VYGYFGKQMPEIVAIVQLSVLPPLGTAKEADQGALHNVFLIADR
jgi:hypothetical protein